MKGIFVKSGEAAPESGYYIYKDNPVQGEVQCLVTKEEKILKLEKGDVVQPIKSCNNHIGLYKLVITKEQLQHP